MTALNMTTSLKGRANQQPPLLIGESVLYFQPHVWVASGKALPSYRVTVSVPFIQEMSLCVTDKRVVFSCRLFRLMRFDWAAWYVTEDSAGDLDRIEEVSIGTSLLLGPYLQMMTSNPVRHWWRSRFARIRIQMKDPEPVCYLISERLGTSSP